MPLPILLLMGMAAGQAPPAFKAGTAIVRVDAQVVDRADRIVTALGRDDFIVFEDRKPQPVLHFAFGDDPLDVLLLIDKSGSMMPVMAELALSATDALAVLRPGDRVGVMLFDTRTYVLLAPTPSAREVAMALESAVREGNAGGGTDINGAVFDAALYTRKQPRREARRSILILTDNYSLKKKKNDTVLRELWEADAVLNALIFQTRMEELAYRYRRLTSPTGFLPVANVKAIVEKTGGESLLAGASMEHFREMLDRIRRRYTLHYRAPAGPGGKMRAIRVELSPDALKRYPGAGVRARRGYVPREEVP